MRIVERSAGAAAALVGMSAGLALPRPVAAAPASPAAIVVGVDHADPGNLDFAHGRAFEYTRDTVQRGETVDFRAAPGKPHIVRLAANAAAARRA